MIDFICMGLLDLWGSQTENYKMKISCPQLDSNPVPFTSEANSISVALLVEISNVDRVLQKFLFKLPVSSQPPRTSIGSGLDSKHWWNPPPPPTHTHTKNFRVYGIKWQWQNEISHYRSFLAYWSLSNIFECMFVTLWNDVVNRAVELHHIHVLGIKPSSVNKNILVICVLIRGQTK